MAYSANDIGRLRAAVPDIFKPQADAGALSVRFRELERFNTGLTLLGSPDAGDASSAGFLLPAALANARRGQLERRRADERSRADHSMLARLKADLDARLAALDAELAAIDKRLGEIQDRRAEIATSLDAMHDIEERRRSGKKLDARDPNDRLLLEAAGMTEEEANGDDYASVIAQRRRDLDREHGALDVEQNGLMKRRGEVMLERLAVVGAKAEIENAHTPEAQVLAERRARTVLGVQQLSEAAYLTDQSGAKEIAAEAVVSNEREQVRAQSETLTRDSLASDAATFRGDTKSFAP